MVAVPPAVPVAIEGQAGPALGHGEDEVDVAAPGLHLLGHHGDHLDDAEAAVGGGQRARPGLGDGVAQVEHAERGVEGLHPLGREVAGHGESLLASEAERGATGRPTVGTAGRRAAQPAAASSADFFERPVILRPSQATGS